MKVKIACDFCGKVIEKYPCHVKKHNFCSRACLADFSSKTRNPKGYGALKSYEKQSEHLSALNRKLNPTRMTDETRGKIREARLIDAENRKSYTKLYGRHQHRIVAEKMLGRPLRPGEVVHHIDGDKQNNSMENLMVFQSQAEHARWHKLHG